MRIYITRIWKNAFWESVELFLAISTLLVGVPMVIDSDKYAPPVMSGLDPFLLNVWAYFILVGGAFWIQGILFANLYTRKAGLMLVAGASIALGGVLIVTGDPFRILGSVTYLLAGFALIARFYALNKLGDALSLATRLNKLLRQGDGNEQA